MYWTSLVLVLVLQLLFLSSNQLLSSALSVCWKCRKSKTDISSYFIWLWPRGRVHWTLYCVDNFFSTLLLLYGSFDLKFHKNFLAIQIFLLGTKLVELCTKNWTPITADFDHTLYSNTAPLYTQFSFFFHWIFPDFGKTLV